MSDLENAYDARRLEALEKQSACIKSVFTNAGCEPVEPVVIQPASIFLDRSGEALRRQIFVFSDTSGEELCLRPEFTIPVCRIYLTRMSGKLSPLKLCYNGSAFRSDNQGSLKREFHQAGVEFIGDESREAADRDVLRLAVAATKAAGLSQMEVTVGHLQLVWSFLGKLDLPQSWRARLRRHFSKPERFRRILEELASGQTGMSKKRRDFLSPFAGLTLDAAKGVVEDALSREGVQVMGRRSVEEIATRCLEQAADVQAERLAPQIVQWIDAFLAVKGPLEAALARINEIARQASVSLDDEIARLRLSLSDLALPAQTPVMFAADLGRGMDYYTGFVFELRSASSEEPLASGGRYDSLLGDLGASKPVPAVGCAIHSERLLDALQAKGRAQ